MEVIKRRKGELLDASNDVLTTILKHLDIRSIASISSTCTKMRALCENKHLWYYLLQRDFGVARDPVFDENISSKDVYKQEKEFDELNARGELAYSHTPTTDLSLILWHCSRERKIKAVKCCIRRGVDITKTNGCGMSALMYASCYGQKEIVKLLIKKGGDINRIDADGWSLLILASRNGWVDMVKFLVGNGADASIVDNYGHTALMHARRFKYESVVEFLTNK